MPKNLKDLVLGLADYEKCGETFEQLIQTSSKKFRKWSQKAQQNGKSIIETIYDSLKRVSIDSNIRTHAQNAGGHVKFKEDYNNDRGLILAWNAFALATIQEMIHQVFDDDELLKASQKLYDSGNLDPSIKDKVDPMIKTNNGKLYQHHILSGACAISDAEMLDRFNEGVNNFFPIFPSGWDRAF